MIDAAATARAGRLLALYRGAHYAARLPGGRRGELIVGARLPEPLASWCAGTSCMLITACNPRSRTLPASENRARLRRLVADLDAIGAQVLPAVGRGPHWREASLLAAGPPIGAIDRLAARYGQNAIVHAAPGGPVRLRLYQREGWDDGGEDLEMAP